MAITVTCPGCRKRFNVSDKFAGKEGPCPKCKTTIKIPTKEEDVVVHAPQVGPKDSKGRPISKPIFREDSRWSPVAAGSIAGAVLVTFAAALVLRFIGIDNWGSLLRNLLLWPGSFALAVPFCYGGYLLVRDFDLEPYRDKELWARVLIAAAAYGLLWVIPLVVIGYLPDLWDAAAIEKDLNTYWIFLTIAVGLMLGAGTAAAHFSFDLSWGSALAHYTTFLGVTILLRMTMALWPL